MIIGWVEIVGVLCSFVCSGVEYVLVLGFENIEVVWIVVLEFFDVKFMIIDGLILDVLNVCLILFVEEESGFVVGYVVVLKLVIGKVGIIGGCDILLVCWFMCGFVVGVKYVDE